MGYTLMTLPDEEFDALMCEIDEELRGRGFAIFQRQMQAICSMGRRFQISINIGGRLDQRVSKWFQEHYGDRLKVDLSLGHSIVIIGGDPYRIRIPMIIHRFRAHADFVHNPEPGDIPLLDLVAGLSDAQKEHMAEADRRGVLRIFEHAWYAFGDMANFVMDPLLKPARGDLRVAVDHIVDGHFQLGMSRWASLQAAEKYLKAFATKHGRSFPYNHDLQKLAEIAEAAGLPGIDRTILANIQCSAGVRYDSSDRDVIRAINAFHSSLSVCGLIAHHYGK